MIIMWDTDRNSGALSEWSSPVSATFVARCLCENLLPEELWVISFGSDVLTQKYNNVK